MGDRQVSVFKSPNWVEFPVQLISQSDAVNRPTRLDRFNAKVHMSEISWVASEDKKLNAALQCWRVIM